eukprot:TRINITY_DN898_c0_g4_i1.p1 TRINITY_DN898_c0_g4~~TRINITY_DN898_c0_g4_i1.p1  ORF type:complete len:812 (+),score=112.26 TRINITY_DN898_c0_g4_i1:146-2437(+)
MEAAEPTPSEQTPQNPETAQQVIPQRERVGGEPWVCAACGFRNVAGNTLCGGYGKLGCKAPAPETAEEAAIRALAAEGIGTSSHSREEPSFEAPGSKVSAASEAQDEVRCLAGLISLGAETVDDSDGVVSQRQKSSLCQVDNEATARQCLLSLEAVPLADNQTVQIDSTAVVLADSTADTAGSLLCEQEPESTDTQAETELRQSLEDCAEKWLDSREILEPRITQTWLDGEQEVGDETASFEDTAAVSQGEAADTKGGYADATTTELDSRPNEIQQVPSLRPSEPSAAASSSTGPPWVCGSCGFRNKAGNARCGGFGRLGCKIERPPDILAALPAEPAEEAAQNWKCCQCDEDNEPTAIECSSCKKDRRYVGILKSVGGDYGFISCPATVARFGRDVYVSRQVLDAGFPNGNDNSGVKVTFVVGSNQDGQPNARSVWPVHDQDSSADYEYWGTIKYISQSKGYGFIECKEIQDQFGGDAYVEISLLYNFSLGQPVRFVIRLGQIGGRPQVRLLYAAGPAPLYLPASDECVGAAEEVLGVAWLPWNDILLFGEGDMSFATAAMQVHPKCHLRATVFLDSAQWHQRFPDLRESLDELTNQGNIVEFNIDATKHSCENHCAVFFNFPCVSVEEASGSSEGLTPSGQLATSFLQNAQETADFGTLLVLGLWGRCDGGADTRLYGQDSHELIAAAIDRPCGRCRLQDALRYGYERAGVKADYGFYRPFEEQGYSFRTNISGAFESSHKEWHLKGCFVLRVVEPYGDGT